MKDVSSSPRPTIAQIALGLFIVWQLIFLFLTNFPLPFTGPNRGVLRQLPERWANLTYQEQAWGLFAAPPAESWFPLLELHWPDRPPLRLSSPSEPADVDSYFHPPGPADRFLLIELNLILLRMPGDPILPETEEGQQRVMAERLRATHQPLLASLRRRLEQFQQQHPEVPPPSEVILRVRIRKAPPPGVVGGPQAADESPPMFRWEPARQVPDGVLPIQLYNLHRQRYEDVPWEAP